MHINRLSGLLNLENATYNCPWEKQSVFRSIPHYSNDCPWALLMVMANRIFPVAPSSFIYPPVPPGVPVVVVSLCPGRHLCPGVPVCNSSSECPSRHLYSLCPRSSFVLWSVISLRTFLVSRSSFTYPPCAPGVPVVVVSLCPGCHLYSLCPGRHLCPGVPVCNFSLSVLVVIYIPCVPVSQSVISLWVSWSSFIFPVSRCPDGHLCPGL